MQSSARALHASVSRRVTSQGGPARETQLLPAGSLPLHLRPIRQSIHTRLPVLQHLTSPSFPRRTGRWHMRRARCGWRRPGRPGVGTGVASQHPRFDRVPPVAASSTCPHLSTLPPPRLAATHAPRRATSTAGAWTRWTAPRSSSSATGSSPSTSRCCRAGAPCWAWWWCPST